MSVITWREPRFDLTTYDTENLRHQFAERLRGRALRAYFFGSFATGTVTHESDIDLVLIKETAEHFVSRPLEFMDLFDIFPRLDVLVYTPAEFQRMLEREDGFFKSAKLSEICLT